MAIDTTPSTVATNALNAIPFSSLIGGPLDACIKAQAQAARTSYEFINEVGLTVDPDTGEKKPVNVTFQYNNNGNLTTLTVPLLVIVPIPYLAIDKVSINFIANISAASSSVEETSTDSELGVNATAEASLGYGPFSIKVNASANYSSKQHSKAATDSKYSVEYTMNIAVEGGQADMPAGLQTVLNILQSSNSSVGPDDMVSMFPAFVDFDRVQTGNLQVTVKDNQGVRVSGTKVQINVQPKVEGESTPFQAINITQGFEEGDVANAAIMSAQGIQLASANDHRLIINRRVFRPYRRRFMQNSNKSRLLTGVSRNNNTLFIGNGSTALATTAFEDGESKVGVTDTQGNVGFEFVLKDEIFTGTQEYQGFIIVTAAVPYNYPNGEQKIEEEVFKVPYAIVPDTPPTGYIIQLQPDNAGPITLKDGGTTSETITVTASALNATELPADYQINVNVMNDSGDQVDTVFKAIVVATGTAEGTPTPSQAAAKVDAGKVGFTFELNTGQPTQASSYTIQIESATADAAPISIQLNAEPA